MIDAAKTTMVSSLALLSSFGCGRKQTIEGMETRGSTTPAIEVKQTLLSGECLEPSKVLLGVAYTCADGIKKTGEYVPPENRECATEGDKACYLGEAFIAVDSKNLTSSVLKKGVTLAGGDGRLPQRNKSADGIKRHRSSKPCFFCSGRLIPIF